MNTVRKTLSIVLCALLLVGIIPTTSYADLTVYTTATGKRYHSTANCNGLTHARNIYTDTESHAISRGLTKCELCWGGSSSSSESSTQSTESAVQDTSAVPETTVTPAVTTETTQSHTIGDFGRMLKKKAYVKKVKLVSKKKLYWIDQRLGKQSGTISIYPSKASALAQYRKLKKTSTSQSIFLYDTTLLSVNRSLSKAKRQAYRNAVTKLLGEKPRYTRW